jgi:hypothetical protein
MQQKSLDFIYFLNLNISEKKSSFLEIKKERIS